MLQHWHNGGGLKACEDNYLVENVREDPGQLLCTDSMAANACAPGFTRFSEAEYKSLKASGNVKGGKKLALLTWGFAFPQVALPGLSILTQTFCNCANEKVM